MITLAPFYKEVDIKTEGVEVNEMSSIFDYKANLYRMHSTFKKHNPSHNFVVTTDNKTKLKGLNVFRTNMEGQNIMESFCSSNLEFIKHSDGDVVLCGSDHLINGNIEKLFVEDFDIALAVVGNPIRVNNTIVLVKNKNKNLVIDFFKRRYDVYKVLTAEEKLWFGDQLSLQRILEQEKILDTKAQNLPLGHFNIQGLKIFIFRYGSEYVNSIKKSIPKIGNPIIVDFKGPKRKKRVEEIYKELMMDEITRILK